MLRIKSASLWVAGVNGSPSRKGYEGQTPTTLIVVSKLGNVLSFVVDPPWMRDGLLSTLKHVDCRGEHWVSGSHMGVNPFHVCEHWIGGVSVEWAEFLLQSVKPMPQGWALDPLHNMAVAVASS